MLYQIMHSLDRIFHFPKARAHCDVPCGIYDPITAQINALTVVRMIDLMDTLTAGEEKPRKDFHNSMSRYVAVKEEHAEKAKHEIRVIWGDFIKEAHVEKYPQLPGLVHRIMQLGSKCRQTANRDHGFALVESINEFAEIFWAIKDIETKKAKAPYAPGLEMVYPDL